MINIFVSYRREDSRHQTGRLYDRLVQKFGDEQIFKDVDSIPFGLDFRQILSERVACCDVLIAVIGDDWLSITDKSGNRRLEDPGDFVRIEIEAALSRQIPVIPVLVGQAGVPGFNELPTSLRDLSFRNGLAVRPDPDFHNDVTRLVLGIEKVVSSIRERSTTTRASPPFATESTSAELDHPSEVIEVAEPPPPTLEPVAEVVEVAEPPPMIAEPVAEVVEVAEPPPTTPEPVVELSAPSSPPLPEPEPPPNRSASGPDGSAKYRIIRPLGSGGKGAAYLAEDELSKTRVALKFPALGSKISAESRARFLEQARSASTLEHPNLCPVLEAGEGEVDHRLFLTRIYIEGESLADWARNPRLTPRHAATMVGKLAIALREAHASGVIHGNLKPSNVIVRKLTDRIEPMIVDFGLAWVNQDEDDLDKAADIQALGVILDELLKGMSSAVEPALEVIRRKAIADRASDRYVRMGDLAADLKGYVRSRPADPLPVSAKPSPSTPLKTYATPARKSSEEQVIESESPSWLDEPQTSVPKPTPVWKPGGKWVPPPPPPPPLPQERTSRFFWSSWSTWSRISLIAVVVGLLCFILYLSGIFKGIGQSSVKADNSSQPTGEPSKLLTNSIV
jgi:serine/threonine protein kinase